MCKVCEAQCVRFARTSDKRSTSVANAEASVRKRSDRAALILEYLRRRWQPRPWRSGALLARGTWIGPRCRHSLSECSDDNVWSGYCCVVGSQPGYTIADGRPSRCTLCRARTQVAEYRTFGRLCVRCVRDRGNYER